MITAVEGGETKGGIKTVVLIRYEGPKELPACQYPDVLKVEMLKPTRVLMGAGLGNDTALITDGRFSGFQCQ